MLGSPCQGPRTGLTPPISTPCPAHPLALRARCARSRRSNRYLDHRRIQVTRSPWNSVRLTVPTHCPADKALGLGCSGAPSRVSALISRGEGAECACSSSISQAVLLSRQARRGRRAESGRLSPTAPRGHSVLASGPSTGEATGNLVGPDQPSRGPLSRPGRVATPPTARVNDRQAQRIGTRHLPDPRYDQTENHG